ncbi:MAG: phosphatidylserine synthase [Hyphomicrobiales bacterium]|nr:phosphatidylserine synthase [Hyphomicrobiales bacterium]
MARPLTLLAMTAAFFLAAPSAAPLHEPTLASVEIYYGPSVDTNIIDAQTIERAVKGVDMAAFVLTNAKIIDALTAAADRGVRVRVYLDRDQSARGTQAQDARLEALARHKGVALKYKAARSEAMHFKAYQIDGRVLRTGSANFSWSGVRAQDNDVVIIHQPRLAVDFAHKFEEMWARSDNEDVR